MSTAIAANDAFLAWVKSGAFDMFADHPEEQAFLAGWEAYGKFLNHDVVRELPSIAAGHVSAEDIYAAYPLKVGKQAAIKAIKKALKDTHMKPQALLDATQAFAAAVAQWPEAEKKFIPHPATWFNAGRYDDDQSAWVKGKPIYQSQFGQSH